MESHSVVADIVDSCFHMISGMLSYCDKYSEGMQRVLKTFGPIPDFSGATVEKVNQVRRLLVENCAGRATGEVLFVARVFAFDFGGSSFLTLPVHSPVMVIGDQ